MHELSLASAVVDTAVRHAGGEPVASVSLRVGALRQVVPESLEFYFGVAARETLCEGARLDLEVIAAALRCEACGREWDPAGSWSFRCPGCGSGGRVLSGGELEVEAIEVAG